MTMRRPTTPEEAYRWHAKALEANGDRARMPPIHENQPQPGWYMRRTVKDGPYVPARIWLEAEVGEDGELLGPEKLLCEVDGRLSNAGSQWTWLASRPISEDRYMDMLAGNFTMSEPEQPDVSPPAYDDAATKPASKAEANLPGKTLF